jgi:broad specificity phosphatase PhoE
MAANSKPIAFLIRHGEDTLSSAKIFVSWIDAPLTDKGREQAAETFKVLDEYDIELVYSSPLQRSLWMAEEYAGAKFVKQTRALLPLNRGILTGSLQSVSDPALKLFRQHRDVAIPYGESRVECEKRLTDFFMPALAEAEHETTAFFTHHSVIDSLNAICKGVHTIEIENLVKPAGVVAVYIDGDGYRLEAIHNADTNDGGGMS